MSANQVFTKAFEAISTEIEFNPKWSNGTGYFDGAVYEENAVILPHGSIAKSSTPTGRRLIFVGTRLGVVVVFDRYDIEGSERGDDNLFVYNTTSQVEQIGWLRNRLLDAEDISLLVSEYGNINKNIGWRIEQFYSACKRSEKRK